MPCVGVGSYMAAVSAHGSPMAHGQASISPPCAREHLVTGKVQAALGLERTLGHAPGQTLTCLSHPVMPRTAATERFSESQGNKGCVTVGGDGC